VLQCDYRVLRETPEAIIYRRTVFRRQIAEHISLDKRRRQEAQHQLEAAVKGDLRDVLSVGEHALCQPGRHHIYPLGKGVEEGFGALPLLKRTGVLAGLTS
jgi:hypothetical protein